MERESNPMEALCRSGCGFYGNPSTDGLCSVCFKEALKKKQQPPSGAMSHVSALSAAAPTVPPCLPPAAANAQKLLNESNVPEAGCSAVETLDESKEDRNDDRKKKNRCGVCRKKVGLTGFECRCGGLFCSVHRYSDKHECAFDYRELGAQEIRRNNPVVVSQKIHKI